MEARGESTKESNVTHVGENSTLAERDVREEPVELFICEVDDRKNIRKVGRGRRERRTVANGELDVARHNPLLLVVTAQM